MLENRWLWFTGTAGNKKQLASALAVSRGQGAEAQPMRRVFLPDACCKYPGIYIQAAFELVNYTGTMRTMALGRELSRG